MVMEMNVRAQCIRMHGNGMLTSLFYSSLCKSLRMSGPRKLGMKRQGALWNVQGWLSTSFNSEYLESLYDQKFLWVFFSLNFVFSGNPPPPPNPLSPFLAAWIYPAPPEIQNNDGYWLFTVAKEVESFPKQEDRLHPFLKVFKAWYHYTSKCNWLCNYSI